MGLTDEVRRISRIVRQIPNIPKEVIKQLEYKLNKLGRKIDKIDPKTMLLKITKIINRTIGENFDRIAVGFNDQVRAIQRSFEKTLDVVIETAKDIPQTVAQQLEEVKEWTREMAENVLDPVKGFIGSVWDRVLPWLVGIIAVILFPVYGPLLMTLFKIIF